MEDSWIYIDDDDASSNSSFTDSDKIDSETEAALYSTIHYEDKLPTLNCNNSERTDAEPSELFVCSPFKINDVLGTDEKKESAQSHSKFKSENSLSKHVSRENNFLENNKSPRRKNVEPNLTPPKKHKTCSEEKKSNIALCPDDSKSMGLKESSKQSKLSNLKSKKTKPCSQTKQNSSKKNDVVIVDSSDSDSDSDFIWREDPLKKSDFKINVLGDTDVIYLSSSDSDNESEIFSSSVKRHSILKNLSMPNIKMGENSKDLWHVNTEDLYRQKKYSQRYHDNFDITCSNCNRKGHTSRTCPAPRAIKCYVCGGGHVGARCENRMCSNCYTLGHDQRRCKKKRNTFFCHLCNMKGHIKENCPDLWRRYHLTTEPVKIKKGQQFQQNTNLYCWNCGKGGHFGGVCPALHLSRNSFNTWPCVISYTNPGSLLKRRLSQPTNTPSNFAKNESANKNRSFNVTMNSSEGRNTYLNPRNGSNVENSIANGPGESKKKKRTDMRFKKIQKVVRQKDFPRTSKKKSPQKTEDNLPESVELALKKKLKKQRQRMNRRKRQRQMKFQKQSLQNLQTSFVT